MSVGDKILPPLIDFKIFVLASPTAGFLDFVASDIPTTGADTLIVGLRN